MTTRAPYSRLSHSGNAPDTTLATGIDNSTLTVAVSDGTGWPDGTAGDFIVTFEPGSSNEEKAVAHSRSGNSITLLQRGFEGAAAAHTASTVVRHSLSATEVDEGNYAVTQTVALVAAKGDVLYGTAANTLGKLAKGSANQAPMWDSTGALVAGNPAPASHTHAESDVTNLPTDLAALQAAPPTGWTLGALLAGKADGTADTVAAGVNGTVLTADSTATGGVSWKTPTVGLLGWAQKDYAGSAKSIVNVAIGAVAAFDSTNMTISFTAPSAGKALLRFSGKMAAGSGAQFQPAWMTHGTTTVVGRSPNGTASSDVGFNNTGTISPCFTQVLTGLTPGTVYQLDFGGTTNGQNVSVSVYDFTLEVWAVL